MTAVPPHWLRANEVTRLPRRHVILDTEAWQRTSGAHRVQTFRLAVACFDHQDKRGERWAKPRWGRFTDTSALWRWVEGCTTAGRRTVVVCHNLGYDLRISEGLRVLPLLGWTLELIRLDGGQAWCRWRKGDRGLTMVDSTSWFGVGVGRLAELIGETKPDLPGWDAGDDVWMARCEADVQVLRLCWGRVLRWIEEADLGNWKSTAAGQGWAAYRHRFMDVRILHHGVVGVAAHEREAAWCGRCEAWRWGRLGRGPWSEWDLESAYAWIGYDLDVPVRLRGHVGARTADRALDADTPGSHLIRARVDTQVPVLPARGEHGILWPVGRFDGWWWDVELTAARQAGALVEPVEGWRYDTAPALRTWATWVLDQIDAPADVLDPVLRLVVKQWSRSLVGRFGARWSTWDLFGAPTPEGVSLSRMRVPDRDGTARLLSLGDRSLVEGDAADAPDGAVHVMSFVMAACRVRLLTVMAAAGFDHLAYVDTDGVIVDRAGSDRLEAAGLPGLRLKGRWRKVEVFGPRSLVVDGQLRAAGVPRRAERSGDRSWRGQVWRSLPVSISLGELSSVVLSDRTWSLTGRDPRRLHLSGGSTAAVVLDGAPCVPQRAARGA